MLRCTIRKSSRRAVVSVASRTALYVKRRRRLPTAETTRKTTCTGFRALRSGRTLWREPARAFGAGPGFLRRGRLRSVPRRLSAGLANSGSCSGSEGRTPLRDRLTMFEEYAVTSAHASIFADIFADDTRPPCGLQFQESARVA